MSLAMASSSRLRLDLERIDSAMEAQQEHQLLGRAIEREREREREKETELDIFLVIPPTVQ